MTEPTQKAQKPSDLRKQERREEKQSGRGRRAELLLNNEAKERARQAVLEDQQEALAKRVAELEDRLDAQERRLNELEESWANAPAS